MTDDPPSSDDRETRDAAANAEGGDPAADVRRWLLEARSATLCTLSTKAGVEGWPFGSIVPYALDDRGRPFVLIADIAAHTQFLTHDPRGTLFVHEPGLEGDPQKGWRATLMGRWQRLAPASKAHAHARSVSDDEMEELDARYKERVPQSTGYRETHAFAYWRLEEILRVRYIAGFGRITWVEGEQVLRDPRAAGFVEAAPPAIAHMNADHRANLVEMCRGIARFTPKDAEMVGLDPAGILVRARDPDGLVHLSFGREITPAEIRPAVIELLKRARAMTA